MPIRPRSCHALFLLTLLAGCLGYRTPMVDPNNGDPAISQAGKGKDARGDGTQLLAICPVEKRYVLLLGDDGQLYSFGNTNDKYLGLTFKGTVSCGSGGLNSMTVSPIGPAYISSQSGDLCSVDTRTFKATRTAFNPLFVGLNSYGMALLPDTSAAGQTLYISIKERENSDRPDHLERIDLSTFALTDIAYVSPVVPSAELTAGPDGELYGFSVGGTESLLLNINPKTASAIDVTKVPAGFAESAFALVYWQDTFYLFLGDANANTSSVYRYRKGDTQVPLIGSVNASVIGAGVACAWD